MLRGILMLALAGLAVCQMPDFDRLSNTMNQLSSNLVQMSQQLDKVVGDRYTRDVQISAYQWRMDRTLGSLCGPQRFQCRGSVQCIASTSVCDGSTECANGSDEDDCSVPFAVGNQYSVAFSPRGACNTKISNMVLTITSFLRNPWYLGSAKVGYMITTTSDTYMRSASTMSVGTGTYYYSNKQLLMGSANSGTMDTLDFRAGGNSQFAIMSFRVGNNWQCNRGVGTAV